MWFDEVATSNNPGRKELKMFVVNVQSFLSFVLDSEDFRFLWGRSLELKDLAWETFQFDIAQSVSELNKAIPRISRIRLHRHGLEGRPLRFKFKVLNTIANQRENINDRFTIRVWFKKVIEAIDAILDSLIHAAGGAGGLIKEFKDALCALS